MGGCGLNSELDNLCNMLSQHNENLCEIKDFFNVKLFTEGVDSFVKIHETDKKSISLRTTKSRAEKIKAQLKSYQQNILDVKC